MLGCQGRFLPQTQLLRGSEGLQPVPRERWPWGRSGHARVNNARKRPCQLLSHQLNRRQRGTCTEGSESFTLQFSSTAHRLPPGLPAPLLPQSMLVAFQEGHRTAFWDDPTCLSVLQGAKQGPSPPKNCSFATVL